MTQVIYFNSNFLIKIYMNIFLILKKQSNIDYDTDLIKLTQKIAIFRNFKFKYFSKILRTQSEEIFYENLT